MKHNTLENLDNIHKYYRVSKVIPGIRDLTRIQREIRETFRPGEAGKFGYGYGIGKENDIRDIVERGTGMRDRDPSFQTIILATYLRKDNTVTYHVCNGLLILLHNNPEGNQRVLMSNLVHRKRHEFLCSWEFFPKSARSHWLLRGHMTSNNETVSRQNLSAVRE